MTGTCTPTPLRLDPNPAWRSYLGGRELRRFRGMPAADDNHFPEDWLASTVRARNGENAQSEDEGISRVTIEGREMALPDLLRGDPAGWWGARPPETCPIDATGVLIKLLDSSTRLHIQAHPDADFVARHFGDTAGKTECWYIVATRTDAAYVYLGFQRAPSRDAWARMIRDQDLDAMLACFDRIPVRPGDCYVVPAGTPHAIGEGILMIEIQEPTDWVVRCEFEVGGLRLPEAARYMGLDLDACLNIFDYTGYPPAAVAARFGQRPAIIATGASHIEEKIIDDAFDRFFRLRRLRGTGPARWTGGELMVLIVTKGSGRLAGGAGDHAAPAGSAWLLPGATREWAWHGERNTPWEVVLAQPPEATRV